MTRNDTLTATGPVTATRSDADRGQVNSSAAEVYEDFFVPALFAQFTRAVLDAADVGPGQRVLDVGCGTGVLARAALARVGPDGAVTGLDRNPGMLAVAQARSPAVTWLEATAEALPLPDGAFDRVVSQFALQFFDDAGAGLAQARRVLAPGGRVAFATWAGIETSPGYAALAGLLSRLFGDAAAQALQAPFTLGDEQALARLVEAQVEDVRVVRQPGFARFASIEAWLHTDIRGWTLAGMVDDDGYDALLEAGRTELRAFTDEKGAVQFEAPALIATGRP